MVLWFTGLSGSGKTTLANYFKNFINLDGDIIRKGINSDLGFSDIDRKENLRRIIEVCKIFENNNLNVITSFISPFEEDRIKAKSEIPNCYIIWIKSGLDKCEERDVKGLYKKARTGEIPNFTGITSVYDNPILCDLVVDTENLSIDESIDMIKKFINKKNKIKYINS